MPFMIRRYELRCLHGYALMQRVKEISHGVVLLKELKALS